MLRGYDAYATAKHKTKHKFNFFENLTLIICHCRYWQTVGKNQRQILDDDDKEIKRTSVSCITVKNYCGKNITERAATIVSCIHSTEGTEIDCGARHHREHTHY